jgi:hypothetical protein
MNPITANAAAAAETPASGPPAPELSHNEQVAKDNAAKETARVAALSPTEREIEEIRRNPKFFAKNDPEQQRLVQRLKQLVTQQTTADEAREWSEAPLATKREFYDLAPPTLPAVIAEVYEENYGWAESELITMARNEGLQSAVVRDLRDEAVKLALQVDGRPLPDDVVDAALAKYDLTPGQRAAFKKLYRELEGGGS